MQETKYKTESSIQVLINEGVLVNTGTEDQFKRTESFLSLRLWMSYRADDGKWYPFYAGG